MRVVATNKPYVIDFLTLFESRVASITEESELSDAMQSIGILRDRSNLGIAETKILSATDANNTFFALLNTTSTSTPRDEEVAAGEHIHDACDRLQSLLAVRLTAAVAKFSAGKLSKILTSLITQPAQDDDLVNAIQHEVEVRLAMMGAAKESDILELLENAAASTNAADRILAGSRDGTKSPLSALKDRVKGLFRLTGGDPVDGVTTNDAPRRFQPVLVEELRVELKQALKCIADAAVKLERTNKIYKASVDQSIYSAEYDILLELGRCDELIDRYRRVSFASETSLDV